MHNQRQHNDQRQELRRNQTRAEALLWHCLRAKRFKIRFRRQHSFGNFILDFYCSKLKLGIEVDGDSHFTDEAQIYDKKRTNFLSVFGIDVIRFTNQEIFENLDGVMEEILRHVSKQTPSQPPPLQGGGIRSPFQGEG